MNATFITASLIIGIITGVFIVIYTFLTKLLSYFLFWGDPYETVSNLPVWYIYAVPIVSILIVNYLINKDEAIKEYGVKEIATAIETNRFDFTLKDLFLKMFASSLSIASGFAIGNEGPSSAIGAMIANRIHRVFTLPKEYLKVSLSIGASSGISAVFVSPITGIMFAIENLAYEFVKDYAGYLILGGVVAFSISCQFLDSLVFDYSTGKFIQFKYILATFLFIPFITFFIFFYLSLKEKVLKFLRNKISQKAKYKTVVISIIGGGVIGTLMLISPYAVFSGHEVVSVLINNNIPLSLWMVLGIVVLRIIATSVSLYSNALGGVFISLMSIGALVGYAFAELANEYFSLGIEPFYFASIGAAVFMGVNMKLPLTALVFALEMTYDYNVLIPTGISVVFVSYLAGLKFNLQKLKLTPLRN